MVESTTAAAIRITTIRIATTHPMQLKSASAASRSLHGNQLRHLVQPGLAVVFIDCVDDAPHDPNPLSTTKGYESSISGLLRAVSILVSPRPGQAAISPRKHRSLGMQRCSTIAQQR